MGIVEPLDGMLAGAGAESGRGFARQHFPDDDPPCDDRPNTWPDCSDRGKIAQQREVVLDHGKEDLGTEVIAVFVRDANAPRPGCVVDDMDHQAHEAIHKVFPALGLALEAAMQEVTVDFGESHASSSLAKTRIPAHLPIVNLIGPRSKRKYPQDGDRGPVGG